MNLKIKRASFFGVADDDSAEAILCEQRTLAEAVGAGMAGVDGDFRVTRHVVMQPNGLFGVLMDVMPVATERYMATTTNGPVQAATVTYDVARPGKADRNEWFAANSFAARKAAEAGVEFVRGLIQGVLNSR